MVKQFKFCHHIPFYVHICIYLKINRHCSLFTLNDSHYNGWCCSHSLFFVPLRLLHATHCPPLHPLPLHSPPVSPSRNLSQKNLHTYPGTIKLWLVRVRHPPPTHTYTHTHQCVYLMEGWWRGRCLCGERTEPHNFYLLSGCWCGRRERWRHQLTHVSVNHLLDVVQEHSNSEDVSLHQPAHRHVQTDMYMFIDAGRFHRRKSIQEMSPSPVWVKGASVPS